MSAILISYVSNLLLAFLGAEAGLPGGRHVEGLLDDRLAHWNRTLALTIFLVGFGKVVGVREVCGFGSQRLLLLALGNLHKDLLEVFLTAELWDSLLLGNFFSEREHRGLEGLSLPWLMHLIGIVGFTLLDVGFFNDLNYRRSRGIFGFLLLFLFESGWLIWS